MRDKASKEECERKERLANEWKRLGLHPALLKWAEIYRLGVRGLHNIEARKLPLDRLNEAKRELTSRISTRIDAEVRPLMPDRISELAGMDVFYGISFESLKQAQKKGTSAATVFGIGLQEFDAHNRWEGNSTIFSSTIRF